MALMKLSGRLEGTKQSGKRKTKRGREKTKWREEKQRGKEKKQSRVEKIRKEFGSKSD